MQTRHSAPSNDREIVVNDNSYACEEREWNNIISGAHRFRKFLRKLESMRPAQNLLRLMPGVPILRLSFSRDPKAFDSNLKGVEHDRRLARACKSAR
jgi:hypothetical protein